MDLESAFQKHGGWIEEFCAAIFKQDTLDVNLYENDNHCELGKWLYGDGKAKYGKLNAYSELISTHAAFHKVAGKVVQAINAKDYKHAENLLNTGGEYATASGLVHSAIQKIKQESQM